MQGTWVQSLVRELRSHMPRATTREETRTLQRRASAAKIKKKKKKVYNKAVV